MLVEDEHLLTFLQLMYFISPFVGKPGQALSGLANREKLLFEGAGGLTTLEELGQPNMTSCCVPVTGCWKLPNGTYAAFLLYVVFIMNM